MSYHDRLNLEKSQTMPCKLLGESDKAWHVELRVAGHTKDEWLSKDYCWYDMRQKRVTIPQWLVGKLAERS